MLRRSIWGDFGQGIAEMVVLDSRGVNGGAVGPLDTRLWWADGQLCVALSGEIDVFTKHFVGEVVNEVRDRGWLPCRVVFVLDGVSFADRQGIAAIRAACDGLVHAGCDVAVKGASERVRRAAELVNTPLPFDVS